MVFFPEKYSRPVLVDIVKASELGWSALACTPGGNPDIASVPSDVTGSRLFQSGSDESSSSRLINPGDVSSGL